MKTKLSVIIVFLFLFSGYGTIAQNGVGLRMGLNMGTVINEFQGEDHEGSKRLPSPGLNIGVFANFGGDVISFSPGINFSTKGATVKNTDFDYTAKSSYNYIELPLLLRITLGDGDFNGYINAGIYAALMASGKIKVKGDNSSETYKIDFDTDHYRRFDMGALVGGGAQYKLGPGRLFLDARFGMGFIGLDSDPADGDKALLNFTPTLAVGYMYAFGE